MPLITFEGIDGCGKSTVLAAVAQRLQERKVPVVCGSDFGPTPAAKLLKPFLTAEPDPLAQYQYVLAARLISCREFLNPALHAGKVVLYDRYLDSTLAYQGRLGVSQQRIQRDHTQFEFPMPVLTIVLDVPVTHARSRRGVASDLIERYHDAFFEVVRHEFLHGDHVGPVRHVVVDARRPLYDVVSECMELIDLRVLRVAAALKALGPDPETQPVLHDNKAA